MRIYKGQSGFEMSVQAFLDLLEEDALEEIVETILSIEEGDAFFADELVDGMMLIANLTEEELEKLLDTSDIEVMDQEEFEAVFGKNEDFPDIASAAAIPQPVKKAPLTAEDLRIRRVIERFGHIDDAD